MSMNATDREPRFSATFLATVDFPLPEPPAIPIMSGLDTAAIFAQSLVRGKAELRNGKVSHRCLGLEAG